MELLLLTTGHRAGNNKWCTRIIYQHTIHLIHHCKVVFALHHLIRVVHHIITQVVETEFVVGSVGDISEIGFATGR